MRSVKTTDDLRRLALVRGASATVGGQSFNSSSEKLKDAKKPEPEIKSVPGTELIEKPAEPPVVSSVAPVVINQVDVLPALKGSIDAMHGYAAKVDETQKSNSLVLDSMKEVISKLAEKEPDKKRSWKLKVNRDLRGILESIDVEQT